MKYTVKDYPEIQSKIEKMRVEELLDVIVCPDFALQVEKPQKYSAALFIQGTTKELVEEMVTPLNQDGTAPALITTDFEYGTGSMIQGSVEFPSMRAVAEAGDPALAYQMGRLTAAKGREAGYHWAFGPCVDILMNRRNPIVSIRTSGEDAETNIRFGGAYMEGMQDGGLIATLKHFPGDGCSFDDQHITTTENPLSREEWDATFGKVYADLIERGAKSIMPGHISLPCYDEIDPETGLYPPATMSKNLLTELLRKKLGFEGIIISDAVIMGGFCGYVNLYHGLARFLEAGGDCLLFVHANEEYHTEMKRQIAEGHLSLETLKNRAYRMLCFAKEYFESEKIPAVPDDEAALHCAETIAKKSIKAVRDRKNTLPLNITKETRIAHIILINSGHKDSAAVPAQKLSEQLREIAGKVDDYLDPGPGNALKIAKSGDYDVLLCSVMNQMSYGLNTVKLSGKVARNMMKGWMRYGVPTVFISYYDPYFCEDYKSIADTVINAYGVCKSTNENIIKILTQPFEKQ